MAKEPPKIRKISMDPDSPVRAAADGDNPIQIGSWSAQGAVGKRHLDTLEFMLEGWPDPLPSFGIVDVAPGVGRKVKRERPIQHPWKKATKGDIKAMQAGVKNCRKLLDDLRILIEIVPTRTLKSSVKAGSLELKNPPSGWSKKKVDVYDKKARETLIKIDKAIWSLILLEDSITTQRPQRAARKAVSAGGKVRAEKTRARNKRIIELRDEGKTYPRISAILAGEGGTISPDAVRKVYERHSEK